MGKFPDRWESYGPCGQPIKDTRFIAFKVPLRLGMLHNLPEDQHFTPEHLLQRLEDEEKSLGLIIDLTNTMRYYKPTCFTENGIDHVKIFTEGHIVPSEKVRKKFFKYVHEFLKENKDNDKLIGVHCTHGLNRTGYLICRYMIDKLNFEPEDAIFEFNRARGHKIERENYLQDLHDGKSCLADFDLDKYVIPQETKKEREKRERSMSKRRKNGHKNQNSRKKDNPMGYHYYNIDDRRSCNRNYDDNSYYGYQRESHNYYSSYQSGHQSYSIAQSYDDPYCFYEDFGNNMNESSFVTSNYGDQLQHEQPINQPLIYNQGYWSQGYQQQHPSNYNNYSNHYTSPYDQERFRGNYRKQPKSHDRKKSKKQ